jgi:hypothetical protein
MRSAILGICMAMFLSEGTSGAQAKKPKKKPAPAPAPATKARFSAEAVELLAATSHSYELNGKAIPASKDTAAILRATNSKDPQVQELGRMACRLVFWHCLLRNEKLDPEIANVAKSNGNDSLLGQLEKAFKAHVKPEELRGLKYGVDAVVATAKGDRKTIESLLFTKPQEQANWSALVRIAGHDLALTMKEKTRALVGVPTKPLPALKDPIKVKLEVTKDKAVVMAITNQARTPLHRCLIFTRAVNDPLKVDKKTQAEIRNHVVAAGLLGASKESIEAGTFGILLQSVMLNMERGGTVFIPEIAAGATVRVPLMTAKEMAYVKSTELSLWSDEVTVASLSAGTLAESLLGGVGTPIALDNRGAAQVTFKLTPRDPRDALTDPKKLPKLSKILTLPMTAGKTYAIQVTSKQRGTDLRVEDSAGTVLMNVNGTLKNTTQLEFTPPADGEYRILCSAAYAAGRFEYVLTVTRR